MSRRSSLLLVVLTLAAIWATWHSPTIFFDNQILLGPSLGVFALFLYGWPGLLVGAAAALSTIPMWGHPWAALLMLLQLIWQQLFLSRINGGPSQVGNGRIVLATIVFWLLIGIPLNIALYTTFLQGDLQSVSALAFKETAVSVVNAGLALVFYLAWQLFRRRNELSDLSLRGVTFAALLLSISVPCIVMLLAMGQQITAQSVGQFRLRLEQQAQSLALVLPANGDPDLPVAIQQRFAGVAFNAINAGGEHWLSNAALLSRIDREYRPSTVQIAPPGSGLTLLVHRHDRSVLEQYLGAYWRYTFRLPPDLAWRQVTVVGPARLEMQQLLGLMKPSLQLLALVLIAAALVSEGLTSLLVGQFRRILAPLRRSAADLSPVPQLQLGRSSIQEVNAMVEAISARSDQILSLQHSLEQERNARARTALTLTERIPVGTFALRRDAHGTIRFTFVSERWLAMLGLERQSVLAQPALALQVVAPPQRSALERRIALALIRGRAFRWEGPLRVGVEDAWMAIEALPRSLSDGTTVWEGVVTDVSERVRAQRQLQEAFFREQATEQQRRELLEQKLKTSLTAAAVVHEIQQPLSTILLNCRLAVQSLESPGSDAIPPALRSRLANLTTAGDRVVTTMERMRMLLRNVETEQTTINVSLCVESALVFLQSDIEEARLQCRTAGIDQPCFLLGDAAQLQIALVNLIRNAIEALQPLPAQHRQLLVQLIDIGDNVQLLVADSGPGFPESFSCDTSWEVLKSTKLSGMGLGLFVAQTAATNHRGRLRIGRSAELGGAELVIDLPR